MPLDRLHAAAIPNLRDGSRSAHRELVAAGRYRRLAPFYMDMEQASPDTTAQLTSYLGAGEAPYDAIDIHSFPDCLVTGQGSVITRNGELVRESALEFLAHGNAPNNLVPDGDGFRLTVPVSRRIDVPCILAQRPWFQNFGHWIVDAAALLALAAEVCEAEQLLIVAGDVGQGRLRQVMLEMMGKIVPRGRVVFHPANETWQFKDLRYVTPVHVPPLFKLPAGLSKLRDAILPEWPDIVPTRKLFVVRGVQPHLRALANSQQVMRMCHQRGYAFLVPDALPPARVAQIFAESKIVIGVKGAALTNALFCRPGAAVVALSPADFPDPFFWDLVAQRDCHYAEVFGAITTQRAQGHNDFVIEPRRFARLLDAADGLAG